MKLNRLLSEAQSEAPSVCCEAWYISRVCSECKKMELSGQTVKAVYPEFCGAHLSIVTFNTVYMRSLSFCMKLFIL